MRRLLLRALALTFAAAATFAATQAGGKDAPAPVVLKPADIEWSERDSGVQVAVLQGDPAKEGPFTLRLRYPAGYSKDPHNHPGDAYVTVLSGSYFRAYGNTFDKSKGIALTPGTFSVNPAGVNHYEWTTEPAEIQVTANGPWTTIYVDGFGEKTD